MNNFSIGGLKLVQKTLYVLAASALILGGVASLATALQVYADTGSGAYIQSDGSLAQPSDYTGDAPRISSGNAIVAYDQNRSSLSGARRLASAEAGSTGEKAAVILMVGLAVAGLSGYAVNAYLEYKREMGL